MVWPPDGAGTVIFTSRPLLLWLYWSTAVAAEQQAALVAVEVLLQAIWMATDGQSRKPALKKM